MAESTSWRCTVCGYVHQGEEPPDTCPVCGVGPELFELVLADTSAPKVSPVRWHCIVCNYIHEGDEPPDVCPVCGAGRDEFEPDEEVAEASLSAVKRRIVIIGGGVAGVTAAEAARQTSSVDDIILLSRDAQHPYYRLNLTRCLAGEMEIDQLKLKPPNWYEEKNIDLRLESEVVAIDEAAKTLQLKSGSNIEWDRLVLAAGAHPFVPPIEGADKKGVYTVRTIEDVEHILALIRDGVHCICIGGGILGIETAGALKSSGATVTLLESHAWLMPRQLNRAAGDVFLRHLESMDIDLRCQAVTTGILGEDRATGVKLKDGSVIEGDLVIITTGVRSNTYLARELGLDVNRGVLVNSRMQTSAPDIYAAGDAAEYDGEVYGLWAPAQKQGQVAGANAAGGSATFSALPRANTIKVLRYDMLSIGTIDPLDGSYVCVDHTDDMVYQHFVFHDGKMVGSVLLKNTAIGPAVIRAIEKKIDFSGVLKKAPQAYSIRDYLEQL